MKEQIEKMAQEICAFCVETCGDCNLISGKPCESVMVEAEHLYNAGYRKQKEGEWVYRENEFGNAYYACSICDCQTRYKENYCSSCGAKMKGGAE